MEGISILHGGFIYQLTTGGHQLGGVRVSDYVTWRLNQSLYGSAERHHFDAEMSPRYSEWSLTKPFVGVT